MIVCTRCGVNNPDEGRLCVSCGHKLQSMRSPGPEMQQKEFLSPLQSSGRGGKSLRALLWRCLEVWGVLVLMLGAAAWTLAEKRWEPGVALVGLAGVYAWLRRG